MGKALYKDIHVYAVEISVIVVCIYNTKEAYRALLTDARYREFHKLFPFITLGTHCPKIISYLCRV